MFFPAYSNANKLSLCSFTHNTFPPNHRFVILANKILCIRRICRACFSRIMMPNVLAPFFGSQCNWFALHGDVVVGLGLAIDRS